MKRDNKGKWQKGNSGNPQGRPQGVGKISELRNQISECIPEILKTIINNAKGGDIQAARLLLERVIPPLKPHSLYIDMPHLDKNTDLIKQAENTMNALIQGEITPENANVIFNGLIGICKVNESEKKLGDNADDGKTQITVKLV